MEPVKRMASDGAWDCLPEEVISLIAIKVAKTSEDPIKDIHSLRLCNKVMKRMTSSSAIANRFNLEHHYLSKVWGGGADALNTYLQTIDWLLGVNNGGALFIKGMADICTGRPSGATLLARAKEEGDLQVSYVLFVLKYYKHHVTNDVFNHIQCFYGEDGDYYEDDACVMGVRHQVSKEIDRVSWREHTNHNRVHEIQMSEDGHSCLWKRGCGQWCTPLFCSLRCRIRAELYEFLIRFPQIIVVMDEIDM
jgi:hypothetical protein